MIKKSRIIVLVLSLVFLGAEALHAGNFFGREKDHDVVFIGIPTSAKEMTFATPAEVMEGDPLDGQRREVVTFRIERVLVGEFAKVPRGGMSKWEQIKEDKLKGALSLKDPQDEVARETIRIAHRNIGEAFGITFGQALPSYRFKIYLKRVSRESETFSFVRSEPVGK